MKYYLLTLFTLLSVFVSGQVKPNYVQYNKLVELKGTDFVLAAIESYGKMMSANNQYLLFIDTRTGQTKQIDFPKDAYIQTIEQIKLDTLGINQVLVVANTVNVNGNKGIDWNDPRQLILLSTDGQEKTQLTEDHYYLRAWTINRNAGTIVTTGYYDSNKNGKYDKADKNEILVYDVRTKKLRNRI